MEKPVQPDLEVRAAKNAIARALDEYTNAPSRESAEWPAKKLRQAIDAKREIHHRRLSQPKRSTPPPFNALILIKTPSEKD